MRISVARVITPFDTLESPGFELAAAEGKGFTDRISRDKCLLAGSLSLARSATIYPVDINDIRAFQASGDQNGDLLRDYLKFGIGSPEGYFPRFGSHIILHFESGNRIIEDSLYEVQQSAPALVTLNA